jgi:hypothetical protein
MRSYTRLIPSRPLPLLPVRNYRRIVHRWVDQTDFLLGKSAKSNREGFPVYVADRLEAVKRKNWKVASYEEQRDWWTPPVIDVPKAFDLMADPKEEYPARLVERGPGYEDRRGFRGKLEEKSANCARHAGSTPPKVGECEQTVPSVVGRALQ